MPSIVLQKHLKPLVILTESLLAALRATPTLSMALVLLSHPLLGACEDAGGSGICSSLRAHGQHNPDEEYQIHLLSSARCAG